MASLYAQRSLASAQTELAGSVQKLSSGRQINSAKDNAAGLGISEGVASIRNISDQSIRNLRSATSLVQTADGALDVVGKMLQRVLTLTTQKTDAVLNAAQTASIDTEITALTDEITRIKSRTTYNDTASVFGRTYTFGSGAGVTTNITIPDVTPLSLGLQNATGTTDALLVSAANASSFSIASHDLANNDRVQYQNLSGTPIVGLVSGTSYNVINRTDGGFQLRDLVSGNTVSITELGGTNDDYFLKTSNSTVFTINEVGSSNTTDVLLLTELWDVDDYVIFNKNASTFDTGNLQDGIAYQVQSNTNSSITLKDLSGNQINFGPNANLAGASLSYLADRKSLNVSNLTILEPGTDSFFTSTGHGYQDGERVIFEEANDNVVVGINTGSYAIIKIDNNQFQLASVAAPTTPLSLSGKAASGSIFIWSSDVSVTNLSIDSILPVNTIQVTNAAGLSDGNTVIFNKISGADIPNLIDGEHYTVTNLSGNTFKLTDKNGISTSITSPQTLGSYSLEKVQKITFDSTSSSAVILGNSVLQTTGAHNYSSGDALVYAVGDINNKLSELDVGRTYYAITTAENNKFRLAETEADAIAGRAIALGTDLAGAHQFTKNSTITTLSVMEAIATNASNRASLGAQLNVLDYAIDNLQTLSNNLSEAYSRIVDTDYAAETAALTRNQILQQAATSMLAQANQMPNVILTLLK